MSLKSILIVSGSTLASRIFGLLRDSIIFAYLGTSPLNAAFLMAFTLPNLFRRLLGEGALTSAFMPILAQISEKESVENANQFLNTILTRLFIGLSILCITCILLLNLIPYIPQLPERWYMSATIGKWLMPYMPMICIAAILSAALNLYGKFAITALAPISLNASMSFCLIIGSYFSQEPWHLIIALSIGVLLGGLLQLLFPLFQLLQTKWRPSWCLEKNTHFHELMTLFLPGVGGAAIFQVNLLVSRLLAFSIDDSSIALLYLGSRLVELPMGIFTLAVVTVIFPQMSRLAAQNNHEIKTVYSQGMRLILAITLPGTVGLIVLAYPIIQVLFKWGAFGTQDVLKAIPVLIICSLGIPLYSWATLSTRAFHALKDTKTPMKIGWLTFLCNTSLSYILMQFFGVKGLAIANIIAIGFQCIYLQHKLSKKNHTFHQLQLLSSLIVILIASFMMGCLLWVLYHTYFAINMHVKYYQILSLCTLIPLGIFIYMGLLWLLGFKDIRILMHLFKNNQNNNTFT